MLVLVVGPSGAGKDTLLRMATRALAEDPRFRFVRRAITRPADAGGEDHDAVSEAEFACKSFALRWQAHGLWYGIPADIADDLARGVEVVANVSRGVIAEAGARFRVRVIEVTAPAPVLMRRLADRGRESTADIEQRLLRRVGIPGGVRIDTVMNDGTIEDGFRQFMTALLLRAV